MGPPLKRPGNVSMELPDAAFICAAELPEFGYTRRRSFRSSNTTASFIGGQLRNISDTIASSAGLPEFGYKRRRSFRSSDTTARRSTGIRVQT